MLKPEKKVSLSALVYLIFRTSLCFQCNEFISRKEDKCVFFFLTDIVLLFSLIMADAAVCPYLTTLLLLMFLVIL